MPFSSCSLILHSALSRHIISAAGRCLIRCSGDQCWWLCVTEAGTEIEWYPTLNNCTISHWIDEIQILQAALILTVPTDVVFNIVTVITFVKIFDGFLITFSRKNWKNHTRVEFFGLLGSQQCPRTKLWLSLTGLCSLHRWDGGVGDYLLPAAVPGRQGTLYS